MKIYSEVVLAVRIFWPLFDKCQEIEGPPDHGSRLQKTSWAEGISPSGLRADLLEGWGNNLSAGNVLEPGRGDLIDYSACDFRNILDPFETGDLIADII
jgi:hypothetical protein